MLDNIKQEMERLNVYMLGLQYESKMFISSVIETWSYMQVERTMNQE